MGFLDGTERSFDLALGPRGHAGAHLAGGHVGLPGDPQRLHHALKHAAFRHRAIIEVEQLRSPLEGEGRIRFRGHRVKQEAQGAFGVLAIHTAVFHVTHATPVIDHTEQHKRRLALAGINPGRGRDVLEVGRRHIELPAVITVFGFKTHRRGLAGEARMVEMPLTQIDIDRGLVEDALWGADQPLGRFDPILLQELDRALGREMPALLVGRPEFQAPQSAHRSVPAPPGQHAGGAAVRPMGCAGFEQRQARYTVVEDTPYTWATAATCAARSGLLGGKRSSRCRSWTRESVGITLRLAITAGERPIHEA